MPRAVQRPAARRDFTIHYVYLAENAGLDIARRFRQAVGSTYAEFSGTTGRVLSAENETDARRLAAASSMGGIVSTLEFNRWCLGLTAPR